MSASNLLRVFALFLALTIPGLASADDVRVKTLRFAKGATSVTQKGSIKGPMSVKYQLTAKAGQVLTVKLISNKGQSYFNVRAPNDGEALFTGATAGTNEWSGRLTEKGRYSVQVLLAPAAAQRNEHEHRHGEQHERKGDGRIGIALHGEVDGQGHRLGAPGEVAGEGDRGPEFAEGARPGEHRPREYRGTEQRQRHRQCDPQPGRAQGCGRFVKAPVGRSQRALHDKDEEGHSHKGLGHDDAGRGERERDPEGRVEPAADDALAAERGEQGNAADDRWQDQWHGDESPHETDPRAT